MSKYLTGLMAGVLLLSGCYRSLEPNFKMPEMIVDEKALQKEILVTAPLSVVQVQGDFILQLTMDPKAPSLQLLAHPADLSRVTLKPDGLGKWVVQTVEKPEKQRAPLILLMRATQLESLSFQGSGKIETSLPLGAPLQLHLLTEGHIEVLGPMEIRYLQAGGTGKIHIKAVQSQNLSVNLKGSVAVKLEGKMHLRHLEMQDNSWLNAFWNDSLFLKVVNKGESFAQIAGVAGTLEIDLHQKARLNTKHLRARKVYVKTYDEARADIFAKEVRNTLAKGKSNIYTYRESDFQSEHTSGQGAVLSIREAKS